MRHGVPVRVCCLRSRRQRLHAFDDGLSWYGMRPLWALMDLFPFSTSGRISCPCDVVISPISVTPRNSLQVLTSSISVFVKKRFGTESMRKKSCSRCRRGMKSWAIWMVLPVVQRKLRMTGSQCIGESWGSGVETSVRIEVLVPATN